jgi:hypothetical protein
MALLREAHAEPVDEAHFEAVRARVLSELERGRRRWWRQAWVYGLAAAAAALLMLAVVWTGAKSKPSVAQTAPPRATAYPPLASSHPGKPTDVGSTRRRPRIRKASVPEPRPVETVLMKLETDNPDVVIYWIAETKGEPQ